VEEWCSRFYGFLTFKRIELIGDTTVISGQRDSIRSFPRRVLKENETAKKSNWRKRPVANKIRGEICAGYAARNPIKQNRLSETISPRWTAN
jgi:hypothetical protein